MTHVIDETHDPARQSWVGSANGHAAFPLQNLPFGVFSPAIGGPRGGVAIGDEIFDLKAALDAGLFEGDARVAAAAAAGPALNKFMALGRASRAALRKRLFELLAADSGGDAERLARNLLHRAADCTLHLPAKIGAYTDFYAGIHHAENGGRRRGQNPPLLANYKHVPVAYHSRASSVRVSGAPVKRPAGQFKLPDEPAPRFGPCRNLDFELELGVWIGPGNALGDTIPIAKATNHIVGLCLLNDWSARDIQYWETQPLGPFLGKNFLTSISPWIVTMEALAPFRRPQPERSDGDPKPLPYLWDDADQADGAFAVAIEALILTETMRARGLPPHRLTASNLDQLYWTVAQMVAHHTCGGCNLEPGDLFGSGTVSAAERSGYACLNELSDAGTRPIELPSGETRTFLQDGDEVIFRAAASRAGFNPIGFGECRGQVVA